MYNKIVKSILRSDENIINLELDTKFNHLFYMLANLVGYIALLQVSQKMFLTKMFPETLLTKR